jgi:hypothetical protein
MLHNLEVLTKRVGAKEDEASKLKKLVNELCAEAGINARYPNVAEANGAFGGVAGIRSDQFYGQTLTAAIRNYLEQRKASGFGAAGLNEIYLAVRDGGYKFESKNEDNAKISVGNTLRKSSSIFHRLPNGQYGLLEWYPSAKAKPESAPAPKKKAKPAEAEKGVATDSPTKTKNDVTNKEIRAVILEQRGQFQNSDIEAATRAKFPAKDLPNTKIPTVIFLLKKTGLIKVVSERSGSKGAVYVKA